MAGYPDDMEIMVESDKYAEDKAKYDRWGIPVCPIDMNYGFVPQNKNAKDNLDKTEYNIRERFNLEPKE